MVILFDRLRDRVVCAWLEPGVIVMTLDYEKRTHRPPCWVYEGSRSCS
jgi:hypothetical protein